MYNRRPTTHGGAAGEHGVSELQNRLSIPSAGAVLSCVLREGQTCLACAIRATLPKHAWSSGTSTSVCPSPVLHHGAQSTAGRWVRSSSWEMLVMVGCSHQNPEAIWHTNGTRPVSILETGL